MNVSFYNEQARVALASGRFDTVLPARRGLLWRTHDYGLLGFQEEGLEESCRTRLRKLLGSCRPPQRGVERAALPVVLLYGLASGRLRLASSPEEDGGLPGRGALVQARDGLLCFTADPCACLAHLAECECAEREAVLGRMLGSAGATPHGTAPVESPQCADHASCGRCQGLLDGACMGSCCTNHGTS